MKKARYSLPEKDRERLNRTEMGSLHMLVGCVSYLRGCKIDLAKRLECIPYGKRLMNMCLGLAERITQDIYGTMPEHQRKHIIGLSGDMEFRMVPKMMPTKIVSVLTKEEAMELVDAAQEHCTGCIKTVCEARDCKLCHLFECVVPLEKGFFDDSLCPYSRNKGLWKDGDDEDG